MRLIAIQKLQMQIATRFIRESLEEFSRQTKPEGARHVLTFLGFQHFVLKRVQTAPDKERSTAEIDNASCEAFIHGHVGFTGERIARIKSRPVAADAFFGAQRFAKGLPQGEATILDGVVRIHFQITAATESQIHDGVFRQKR